MLSARRVREAFCPGSLLQLLSHTRALLLPTRCLSGIVLRMSRNKFRRDVFLNRVLSNEGTGSSESIKEALESEVCVFYLFNNQGQMFKMFLFLLYIAAQA